MLLTAFALVHALSATVRAEEPEACRVSLECKVEDDIIKGYGSVGLVETTKQIDPISGALELVHINSLKYSVFSDMEQRHSFIDACEKLKKSQANLAACPPQTSLNPYIFRIDRPGFSMENVPVSDQGFTTTCHAVAASELLDAWRFTQEKDLPTNQSQQLILSLELAALSLADQSNVSVATNDGGYISDDLEMVQKVGGCLVDSRFETALNPLPYLDYWGDRFWQKDLPDGFQIFKNLEALNSTESHDAISAVLKSFLNLQKSLVKTQTYLKSLQLSEEEQAATIRYQGSALIVQSLKPYCDQHRWKPTKIFSFEGYRVRESISEAYPFIHDEFIKKNAAQPVAVSFCSSILKKGHGIGQTSLIDSNGKCPGTTGHTAVIVGERRDASGLVQLLIQNSWGENYQYHSDWESDHGKVWVDRDLLLKNTADLIKLKALNQ